MKRKLSDIADITQGSILTRIKAEHGELMKAITMQQLSYYVNASDDSGNDNLIIVNPTKIENLCVAEVGDLLIGLSSCKAMVIEEKDKGKVILSNFIRVKANEEVIDSNFLCWALNENKMIQSSMQSFVQGTTRVAIIPPTFFKNVEIDLIPLSKQKRIGQTYQLIRKKTRLDRDKSKMMSLAYNEMLIEEYKKIMEENKQ